MKKKTLIIIVLIIIAVLALGAYIAFKVLNKSPEMKASRFTAVYMTSGDIYFGKMDWFPWPRMKSVWYLQRSVDQSNNPQLGIAPFKKIVWSPIDEIYLNPKQMILWTKIKADSELAKALENPSSVTSDSQQQNSRLQEELNQIAPQDESATTTEKSPSKK
jgi:hypothetical protein